MTMRALGERAIRRYLAAAGPAVLSSVGAYQVGVLGSTCSSAIEGDQSTILGLAFAGSAAMARAQGFLAI